MPLSLHRGPKWLKLYNDNKFKCYTNYLKKLIKIKNFLKNMPLKLFSLLQGPRSICVHFSHAGTAAQPLAIMFLKTYCFVKFNSLEHSQDIDNTLFYFFIHMHCCELSKMSPLERWCKIKLKLINVCFQDCQSLPPPHINVKSQQW